MTAWWVPVVTTSGGVTLGWLLNARTNRDALAARIRFDLATRRRAEKRELVVRLLALFARAEQAIAQHYTSASFIAFGMSVLREHPSADEEKIRAAFVERKEQIDREMAELRATRDAVELLGLEAKLLRLTSVEIAIMQLQISLYGPSHYLGSLPSDLSSIEWPDMDVLRLEREAETQKLEGVRRSVLAAAVQELDDSSLEPAPRPGLFDRSKSQLAAWRRSKDKGATPPASV